MEQTTASNPQPTVPEVSVICTARNAAPTIEATIQSIVAQDFQNWEMIIVDDGSIDDTVSVVSRYAEADPRLRLVTTGGIGRGRALNRAIAEARADLIANLDADDLSHPERLRRQVEAMALCSQFAILSTGRIIVAGMAPPVWPDVVPEGNADVVDVTRSLAWGNPVCHSSVLMRKAAIIELGGYEETRRFVFDYDLWARCAAAGLRIGLIQMPLVAKRVHPGQKYMHAARVHYMYAGLRVHARAMRAVGVGTYYLPVMAAVRLVSLILPLGVRVRLSRLRASRGLRRSHLQ